jgi:hypothetical protein
MKSGYKTTEFWVLLAFGLLNVLGVLFGLITNPAVATVATTILGVAYTVARAIAKMHDVALPEAEKKTE